MPNANVMIQLPSGEVKTVSLPNDVSMQELMPELVTTLGVPVTGPDGRPISYRMDSKSLGRSLQDEETLQEASVPDGDRLILSPVVVAGAIVRWQSPSLW
jgi:hypothetical protein